MNESTGSNGRRAPIPGFTVEQSWALQVVADAAAKAAVQELIKSGCPFACDDMAAVKTVVFGRSEAGIKGLDDRVATNERSITRLESSKRWMLDRIVAPVLVAVIASVVSIFGTLAATGQLGG